MQTFLLAAALALVGIQPIHAAAQWREYVFNDLGLAIAFPAEPTREDSEYQTVIIGYEPVAATNFNAYLGEASFKLTAVDLRTPELIALGANIMGECYFDIEREGVPVANIAHRAEDGTRYGVHGRIVTVDIEEVGRRELGCFVAKGRLYRTETVIPLNANELDTAAVARFVKSIRFDVGALPE